MFMVDPPVDTTVMRQTTNAVTNQASTTRTEPTRAGVSTTGERTTRGFAVVVAASVAVVAAAMAPVVAASVAVAVGVVVATVVAVRRGANGATRPPDRTRTEMAESTEPTAVAAD